MIPLNLFFRCEHLVNKDLVSRSDPQLSLFILTNTNWKLIGKTEVVQDNLSPVFCTSMPVEYSFNITQTLKVEVHDIDKNASNFLGQAVFELNTLVASKDAFKVDLKQHDEKKIHKGGVIIKFEKTGGRKNLLDFEFHVDHVEDIEILSKSDPFLRFYKFVSTKKDVNPDDVNVNHDEWMMVHQTEHKDDNLNPKFNRFSIDNHVLCSGDPNAMIRVEVWDNSSKGDHRIIGWLYFTLREIQDNRKSWQFKSKRKPKKSAGELKLVFFRSFVMYDIIDYINFGLTMNMFIAVDFTTSNGSPNSKTSLHYLNAPNGNQYQQALSAISNILLNFDIDKVVPLYGFGGKKKDGLSGVEHAFPMTGNPAKTSGHFVQGILEVYQNAFEIYELSAPTYFSPILEKATQLCAMGANASIKNYMILLILTDGEIFDFQQTKRLLVYASTLPMSVIIVGVGNDDFKNMEELDCDKGKLTDEDGRAAVRDVVQFVPFRKYNFDPAMLAQETLKELPKQINEFYQMKGMKPF